MQRVPVTSICWPRLKHPLQDRGHETRDLDGPLARRITTRVGDHIVDDIPHVQDACCTGPKTSPFGGLVHLGKQQIKAPEITESRGGRKPLVRGLVQHLVGVERGWVLGVSQPGGFFGQHTIPDEGLVREHRLEPLRLVGGDRAQTKSIVVVHGSVGRCAQVASVNVDALQQWCYLPQHCQLVREALHEGDLVVSRVVLVLAQQARQFERFAVRVDELNVPLDTREGVRRLLPKHVLDGQEEVVFRCGQRPVDEITLEFAYSQVELDAVVRD